MSEVAFVTFLNTYLTPRRSEQNVEFKVSTRVCDENAQSHKLAGDTVSTALFLFQIRKYIISNAFFQNTCVVVFQPKHKNVTGFKYRVRCSCDSGVALMFCL